MTEIWGHRIVSSFSSLSRCELTKSSRTGGEAHREGLSRFLPRLVSRCSRTRRKLLPVPRAHRSGGKAVLSSPRSLRPLRRLSRLETVCLMCYRPARTDNDTRHTSGARECYTHLYKPSGDGMRDLIGPATIIWDTPITPLPPPNDALFYGRTVLVRLHPSICASAYEAFDAVETNLFCGVRRCEKEFITIEVTGRRATEVVKAVLKPVLASSPATKEVSGFERAALAEGC